MIKLSNRQDVINWGKTIMEHHFAHAGHDETPPQWLKIDPAEFNKAIIVLELDDIAPLKPRDE